ncbi:hypothetical protein A8C56_12175 [Niabella ginsenosidivorans]|uniref:FecR protein domain-containing protein n=1 Tax=Niabella ginsenosidivorans TaxID=1176587 RepID=A0A1A9I1Y0_9BACT|nr:FecR domain-containing protein [Niabella ginsenosidivorans]ANH81633.1 hypothetical protein A8C56_12160 [Niabella ginsenosidivorans]ANH81636.1 hypothetical protein A8C56_12175 [Niabella ginsenosidivorans]
MLSKEEIERLQNIVRDKSLSIEERRNAFLQLQEEEAILLESAWKDFYEEYSASFNRSQTNPEKHRIYKKITQKLNIGPYNKPASTGAGRPRPLRLLRFIAGAAALLVIAAGLYYLFQSSGSAGAGKDLLAGKEQHPLRSSSTEFDTIVNTSKHFQAFLLPDSSLAELAPQSVVYYKKGFAADGRIVFLQGAGKFSVHKKAAKPFSVYVDGMEVRDLGTVFYVQSAEKKLKVRLIKGKILVRSLKASVSIPEIVLSPGQEINVNTATGAYAVQNKVVPRRKKQNEEHPDLNQMLLTRELSFNSAPIGEVVKELGKEFGVTIMIKQVPAKDLLFTGQFLEYMSLAKILDVIARSYNLKVYYSGSTVVLKK